MRKEVAEWESEEREGGLGFREMIEGFEVEERVFGGVKERVLHGNWLNCETADMVSFEVEGWLID